jgi:hypothetical protein
LAVHGDGVGLEDRRIEHAHLDRRQGNGGRLLRRSDQGPGAERYKRYRAMDEEGPSGHEPESAFVKENCKDS